MREAEEEECMNEVDAGHVCDRTPSLGGPAVRQEATCVAAASGPRR